jgi:hypothetical protein
VPTRLVSASLALGLAMAFIRPCDGQTARPRPRLFHAFPAGGQAGGSVDVTVGGEAIDGADGLWFSNPGLTAVPVTGKPRTFRVAISPDAPLGLHDVRALTPDGLSNPRTFEVGSLAESLESEPNNVPASANPIGINTVVDGTTAATDVDCFAFPGKKGQRLFIDLEAERVESPLDATIRLLDGRGVEVAESRDAFGADPFLDVTLPSDGCYVIKVHDVTYAGSPEHVYRLTLRNGPHLDVAQPAIARGGRPIELVLLGRNIGGSPLPTPLEGGRVEARDWSGIPTFLSASELPINALGTAALMRGFPIGIGRAGDVSNTVLVAEVDQPVVSEHEPNGPDSPQRVVLPCSVGGCFGARGDLDAYRFEARKGEAWRIEAIAEGIGSPADTAFVLQRVPASGDPQDLVSADDSPDPGLAPRFNLASSDAKVRWVAPADGTYQVVLNDVAGSSRGDPRLAYRLAIRRERPDFRLFVVPQAINVVDAVTVRRGGRAVAEVLAWRLDGFSGPIKVHAEGLPEGLRCDPVIIPAGSVATPLVLEADSDAQVSVGVVRLVGLSGDLRREAIPGTVVRPPVKIQNVAATVAPARAARGFAVAIREASPFLLTAKARRAVVAAGQALELETSIGRAPGSSGPVALTAWEPLAGSSPTPATLKGEDASVALSWPIPPALAPGLYSVVLKGSGTYQPDPKAKAVFNVEEPSNPVLFRVRPAPARISFAAVPGLKPGGKAEVDIKFERLNGFVGPIAVRLDAPAASKLSADPMTIAPGQVLGKLTIRATAQSPPGPAALTVRAEAVVEGDTVEIAAPLKLTIEKP